MPPKASSKKKDTTSTPSLGRRVLLPAVCVLVAFVAALVILNNEKLEPLSEFSLPSDEKYQRVIKHEALRQKLLTKKLTAAEQAEKDKGYENNQFNQFISDRMPLSRYFYDTRDVACLKKRYHAVDRMPTMSVIIIFYNEARSTLLRTVQSVLDRTPRSLLHEIILVDDSSTHEHLKAPLDEDLKKFQKTSILRLTERSGLIRAKVHGAKAATGDVLMFMDSHCECVDGWAEPLLDRIMRDRKTIAMPVIDAVEEGTWEFRTSILQRGVFTWHLQFYWLDITESEAKARGSSIAPIVTPAMAGGIFAMDRKYFFEIGAYDMGMDTWGGENMEMSFRVWMCGGRLEILPCSRVGHVFRRKSPYTFKKDPAETIAHNLNRAASVWMDEYADIYLNYTGNARYEMSDVTERAQLRKDLKCHDFKWYLDNVFADAFVPMPANALANGYVSSPTDDMCLVQATHGEDARFAERVSVALQPCDVSGIASPFETTFWYLTKQPFAGQLRNEDAYGARCMMPLGLNPGSHVTLVHCHHYEEGRMLTWSQTSAGELKHYESGLCLTRQGETIALDDCVGSPEQQVWKFFLDLPAVTIVEGEGEGEGEVVGEEVELGGDAADAVDELVDAVADTEGADEA